MFFFSAFKNSLANAVWIRAQKNAPGRAWSYFFLLMLALAFVFTALVLAFAPGLLKQARQTVVTEIPNFTAQLRKGVLSVQGLPQPYSLSDSQTILVVNTAASTSPAIREFIKSPAQSGILVASDRVEFYQAGSNTTRVNYWANVPDAQLTKSSLVAGLDSLYKPKTVALLIISFLLAFFVALAVVKLLALLVVTFVVFVISSSLKRGWQFKQLFNVGLYAVTLPSLIQLAATFLGIRVSYIFSLALVAFMLAIVFTKEDEKKEVKI